MCVCVCVCEWGGGVHAVFVCVLFVCWGRCARRGGCVGRVCVWGMCVL